MADDEILKYTGIKISIDELKDKISELEKKFSDKCYCYADNPRIEKLELDRKAQTKQIEYWGERIEKLESHYKEHFEKGFHHKQIDELKEQVEQLKGYTYNQSDDKWHTINNIEEVLRELNQIVKGINYDLNIRKLFGSDIYNHYSERLAENERKLEGGDNV